MAAGPALQGNNMNTNQQSEVKLPKLVADTSDVLGRCINSVDGFSFAEMCWSSRKHRDSVVRAVNSHDQLLAGLRQLLQAADNSNCDSMACDAARTALAAAEATK